MTVALSVSALMGYLLGSLSPSALLDKLKHANLRKRGTRNLGATNTFMVIGKKWGILVMLFDICKAFFAVYLSRWIFPLVPLASLVSGTCAVLGHVYPFYLKFRGGKGLAAFGGLLLAVDPLLFLILLVIAVAMMIIFNYAEAAPISAGILFPVLYGIRSLDLWSTAVIALAGIVIVIKNAAGIGRVRRGEEDGARKGLRKLFTGKLKAD